MFEMLSRGATANFRQGMIPGILSVNCVIGAQYTISINGKAPVVHVATKNQLDSYAINGNAASVANSTPGAGPTNITLNW